MMKVKLPQPTGRHMRKIVEVEKEDFINRILLSTYWFYEVSLPEDGISIRLRHTDGVITLDKNKKRIFQLKENTIYKTHNTLDGPCFFFSDGVGYEIIYVTVTSNGEDTKRTFKTISWLLKKMEEGYTPTDIYVMLNL